ncbi:MAG: hypothetical protein JJE09_04600 [Bacteroidia bacterium]|nr:hypothetical protein [Bacteroidia bacterium]
MHRIFLFLFIIILFVTHSFAQQSSKNANSIDLGLAFGSSQGTFSGAFIHNWELGKKKNIEVGAGGRLTEYVGANQYYSTAPAKLTSGSIGPGVFFKENIIENVDTFLIAKPRVLAFNAMINLGYCMTEKFTLGFNIDVIGFSLGSEKSGNYINGSKGQVTTAQPSPFNLLLISDNDLGSLNSEFYGKYLLSKKLSLKAGFQFLFTEYTTSIEVQQFPEPNDRFRNKSGLVTVGISLTLN